MRLAFDLDNTLIRCGHDFTLERPQCNRLARLLFGIGLLVDDSEGVRIEGERHGFRVLVAAPADAAGNCGIG